MTSTEAGTDTPMLRQFKAIKANYPDSILFFRLGDFYEMFLDDAKIASKELDLTLTGRGKDDNRIPMCGVPFHAADSYVNRLVNRGFKVAICEQVEDPAAAVGLTRREVVKVVTPGTNLTPGGVADSDNAFLAAICSIPKSDRWALAFADGTTGEFRCAELESVTQLSMALSRINPKEVLLPTGISLPLSDSVSKSRFNPLPIDGACLKLRHHFQIQSLTSFGLAELDHCAAACWAIIEYLKFTLGEQLPQIRQIQRIALNAHCQIDGVTQRNLELLINPNSGKASGSLFHHLNFCKTSTGARRLKQLLSAPFVEAITIQNRLAAVAELKQDLLSREELRAVLSEVQDVARLTTRIVAHKQNPKELIALKSSLMALGQCLLILEHFQSPELTRLTEFFRTFSKPDSAFQFIISLIERAIIPEPPAVIRDGFFIQTGYSAELDSLTQSFSEIREWIKNLEPLERERSGIKSLKVGYNKVFGYYFEIPNSYRDDVPTDYIRKQTLSNAERYITPELKEKETILLNGADKQIQLECELFREIVAQIEPFVSELQQLSAEVAELDVFQSLATAAQKYNFVSPEVVQDDPAFLEIEEGRHPILANQTGVSVVPNSISMSSAQNRFMFITGPNMAGKSTLMRQTALLIVMAQIGSQVPAKSMRWAIVDQLFSRIGASDNVSVGHSTFMVEMLETANIVHNATLNSFILLDEIGRGTATYDGISLAGAISLHIYSKIRARTMFASHYHELTVLADQHPGFNNFSMSIVEHKEDIVFTYQLISGPADKSYGIHVAKLAGLPAELVGAANALLKGIESEGPQFLKRATSSEPESRPKTPVNQLFLF